MPNVLASLSRAQFGRPVPIIPVVPIGTGRPVMQQASPYPFGPPSITRPFLRGVAASFGRDGRMRLRTRRGMGQSDDGSDGSGFTDDNLDMSVFDGVGDTITSDDGLSAVDTTSLQNYVNDASASSSPSTGSLTSLLAGSGLNLGQVVNVLGQYLTSGNTNAAQTQYLQAELAYAQQQAQLQVAQSQISAKSNSTLFLVAGGALVLWLVMKK